MLEKIVGVWLFNFGLDMVYIEFSWIIVIVIIGSNFRGFVRLFFFMECKL